ncbi:MAG: hypothetical protein JWO71_2055 [Candidatus Acidoferrum typicum]|nr:hypothetical protein [Candidatus Acidoferrum typicum]
MSRKQLTIWVLLTAIVLIALRPRATYAQDSGQAPKSPMNVDGMAALESNAPTDMPDTRPLGGVQDLSLGSQASRHSFLLPSFGVISQVQFNPYESKPAGNSSPATSTYVSGRLALNKISARSETLLDYLAAGAFATNSNQGNSIVQSVDFAETIKGGRWSHVFGDQFTYLPGSSFNFGGLGGLGNFGLGLSSVGLTPGFRQDLVPNQSVLTNAAAISNAAFVQTTYALGYRSSLNFFGTYGTLHFLDNGFQNSSSVSGGASYGYLLSPLNSMAVSYGFNRFIFPHLPVGADSHTVQLSFARRITGRMSFQAGAGPEIQVYRSPLAGSGTVLSWTANAGVNYRLREWGASLYYSHSLGGGSGVLAGAEADTVSGHLSRGFGKWRGFTSVGYARNRALQQTSIHVIAPQSWFGGAQISRGFGTLGSFFLSYNASRQSSLAAVCSVPACASNQLMQTISVGYNWGFRPIVLE